MKISIKLPGFGVLLTIVFAVLKLVGVVNWSWLVVCLPLIAGIVLTVLLAIGMFIYMRIIMKKFK